MTGKFVGFRAGHAGCQTSLMICWDYVEAVRQIETSIIFEMTGNEDKTVERTVEFDTEDNALQAYSQLMRKFVD